MFQINNQRVTFNCIDTCRLTKYNKNTLKYILLGYNKHWLVANGPGINDILSKIYKDKHLNDYIARNM